jgi:nucleoside-diphosphate-sugar epimerase
MGRILVTGSLGQIGTELSVELCRRYGSDNVIISDIKNRLNYDAPWDCESVFLDVTDPKQIDKTVEDYHVDTIYHLAAILSATAETNPQVAWHININGLYYILEIARKFACKVFVPSSIGAFGPSTPKHQTPQDTIQRPTTIYGISKAASELLCDYYFKRFGVDTRGVRYPGIISYKTFPGGGTTDYAVEIYYDAILKKQYTSFIAPGSFLDMMYMPVAIKAAIDLMDADPAKLKHRNAYNVTAMSVDPGQIAAAIRKQIPDFIIDYEVDPVRQAIADSWPDAIDDSAAREEWCWQPQYDLDKMTADMLVHLREKLELETEEQEN